MKMSRIDKYEQTARHGISMIIVKVRSRILLLHWSYHASKLSKLYHACWPSKYGLHSQLWFRSGIKTQWSHSLYMKSPSKPKSFAFDWAARRTKTNFFYASSDWRTTKRFEICLHNTNCNILPWDHDIQHIKQEKQELHNSTLSLSS
jgi:hypothetical protein